MLIIFTFAIRSAKEMCNVDGRELYMLASVSTILDTLDSTPQSIKYSNLR